MVCYEFISEELTAVFLSNGFGKTSTRVGKIKKCADGWRYFAKGNNIPGEPFPTINACKRSLEEL
jgi:hypothetical protein